MKRYQQIADPIYMLQIAALLHDSNQLPIAKANVLLIRELHVTFGCGCHVFMHSSATKWRQCVDEGSSLEEYVLIETTKHLIVGVTLQYV